MLIGLAYPQLARWPKFRWVHEAFAALGHSTRRIQSTGDLQSADNECDVVFFTQRGAGLCDADVIKMAPGHRAKWIMWNFDLIATESERLLADQPWLACPNGGGPTMQSQMMRAMDVVLVKERGLLNEYCDLGINAYWADQACPKWLGQCEHRENPEWDVLVYGSWGKLWSQRRKDVNALIDYGFTVAWAGHMGGVAPPPGALALPFCMVEDLPKLASRAAVVLGVNARSDLDGYWSDRFWLALGMGACLVHRKSEGLPLINGQHPYTTYLDADDLIECVTVLRANQSRRESMGHFARDCVMSNHTYEHRCGEILEQLCSIQAKANAEPAKANAR